MMFDSGWGLSWVVFLPLVGAAVVLMIPRANEQAIKVVSLATALGAFGASIGVAAAFDYGQSGFQFGADLSWIPAINARFHIGIDGISLPMLVLSTFIIVLAVVYSWNHWPEPHNPKAFLVLMLLLATGMNGTFVALDLVLFFIFFEIVLLPMYFMIGIWGDRKMIKLPGFKREVETRLYASIKFFLFTLFGSALMLLGFLALYFKSDPHTFDMVALAEMGRAGVFVGAFGFWVFGALFVGFAVKVPMWPVHTWLPDAHTAAPTVGSVILAAVLLKLGSYGFIRISLPILPQEAQDWAPVIAILAVISIIYGSLACLAQTDMKRLIAFSSVGHMGFVMLGISTLTDIRDQCGGDRDGRPRCHHRAAVLPGRLHAAPVPHEGDVASRRQHEGHACARGILAFTAMASLGLPGLAGFWGEFMALLASFNPLDGLSLSLFRTAMVVGAIGTVLTAGYLLWMLQRVNLGEVPEEWEGKEIADADAFELAAWVPLVLAILAIGIFPRIIFGATNDAVVNLVRSAFGG